MASEEPASKKQKTEEEPPSETPKEGGDAPKEGGDAEMKSEEPKEPEPPKAPEPPPELETDAAPPKKGTTIKDPVVFLTQDTTMNVMASTVGGLLMPLTDGGVQHLLAGARASVGIKSGRYMFEAKIMETLSPVADTNARRTTDQNKQYFRIGFSTEGSSLFVGQNENGVCFDADGSMVTAQKKTALQRPFGRGQVVSVLLNLDDKSPNKNTISYFLNGERACQPQPLPEGLVGKTLYPTVTFRCLTVHVNFGSSSLANLPFKCLMVQDASQKDAVATMFTPPKDGKYDVIFPVGLPDEGPFEWLDGFLKSHPNYTELSDRMVLDWAQQSGLLKPQAHPSTQPSNDKPAFGFGARELDDFSIRRVLYSVAASQSRNFVVMEVKGNLDKDERAATLSKFAGGGFKKIACILVGEPPADFKKKTHEVILKTKQEQSDRTFRFEQEELKRKKALEKRQREVEKMRKKQQKDAEKAIKAAEKARKKAEREFKKKMEEEAKKREEEAKKKAEEEAKAKAAAEGKEEEEKKEEEEPKKEEEEKKEPEPEEEEEEEAEEEEEPEEPEPPEEPEKQPPKVELSADDKKIFFVKKLIPDISQDALSSNFAKFNLPDKDEGFDELKFEWNKSEKSKAYIKKWVLDRKLTMKIDNLQPSQWFHDKLRAWQGFQSKCQAKQKEYVDSVNRKAAEKAAKKAEAARKAAAEAAAKEAAEKAAAEKKEGEEGGEKKEGDEEKKEDVEMKPSDEKKEEEKEEEEEAPFDFDGLEDVFGVKDIFDLGGGMPLVKDFQYEDWMMLALRFEVHLLAHAFKHDVEDPERQGIIIDNLPFYYNKYFKKSLHPKFYGVDGYADLMKLIKDTIWLDKTTPVIESQLDADMEVMEIFVKLTEEERRNRALRIDLGEDGAKLKIMQAQQNYGEKGGKDWHKGGGKDWNKGGFQDGGFKGGGYKGGYDKGGKGDGGYGKSGKDWNQGKGDFKGGKDWGKGGKQMQPPPQQQQQQNWGQPYNKGQQNWQKGK